METMLTAVGFIGVGMVLIAYFLLQSGRFTAASGGYTALNIGGSCCILVSLTVAWNWPSVGMQLSWIAISLYGLLRRTMLSSAHRSVNGE